MFIKVQTPYLVLKSKALMFQVMLVESHFFMPKSREIGCDANPLPIQFQFDQKKHQNKIKSHKET